MNIDLSEYAYPMAESSVQRGLSKREVFALHILSGMMAQEQAWGANRHLLASDAVKTADALITALEE